MPIWVAILVVVAMGAIMINLLRLMNQTNCDECGSTNVRSWQLSLRGSGIRYECQQCGYKWDYML